MSERGPQPRNKLARQRLACIISIASGSAQLTLPSFKGHQNRRMRTPGHPEATVSYVLRQPSNMT